MDMHDPSTPGEILAGWLEDRLQWGDFSLTPGLRYDHVTTEGKPNLAPRYNDQTTALNAENILTSAATPDNTDNTSIWLIVWGPNTIFCTYPKGSKAGFQIEDKGQVTIENVDGSGGRMESYRSHYRWDCGLSVRDWRYIVRIANIDVTTLTKDASSGADLFDLMAQAMAKIPSRNNARFSWYCNQTIIGFLGRQARFAKNVKVLTFKDVNVEELSGKAYELPKEFAVGE